MAGKFDAASERRNPDMGLISEVKIVMILCLVAIVGIIASGIHSVFHASEIQMLTSPGDLCANVVDKNFVLKCKESLFPQGANNSASSGGNLSVQPDFLSAIILQKNVEMQRSWGSLAIAWSRVHWVLTIMTITFSAMVAAGSGHNSLIVAQIFGRRWQVIVALLSAISAGLLGSLAPLSRSEKYWEAWRILNISCLEYLSSGMANTARLVEGIREGEAVFSEKIAQTLRRTNQINNEVDQKMSAAKQ